MTQLKHDLNILNKLQTLGTIMMRISKRCWKNWYCRTRGKLEVKTEVIRSAINYLHYFWFRLPAPASGDDGQTHWCWRCSPWWHWCYDAVLYDEMAMLATWLWLLFYWWSLLLIKGLLAVGRIVKGCFFIPLGGERWSWWRRCRRRGPRRCGGAEVGSRTSDQLPVFIRDMVSDQKLGGDDDQRYRKRFLPACNEGEETRREISRRIDGRARI